MKVQRTLAPTAAPVSIWTAVRAGKGLWGRGTTRDRIEIELRQYFGANDVLLVSSGKAALTLILLALARTSPRRRIVMPAYTCYSVPSSVIKAGLEVVPCDVDPRTLDFNFQDLERVLDDHTLCVLSTHLFGASADTARVMTLCRNRGIIVIEDAAQAFGGTVEGRRIGSIGDVAFFSLGRGKNVSCGSGGIVVARSESLATRLREEYAQWPDPSFGERMRTWVEVIMTALFLRPWLYWFPAGLPFLGLGETKFDTSFALARMDDVRASLLDGWRERLECLNHRRGKAATKLLGMMAGMKDVWPLPRRETQYLRLPVLVRDHIVKDTLCRLGCEEGLGISRSYPATIAHIPELQGRIAVGPFPGAQTVVDRLVTLPIHEFVNDQDRVRIISTIKRSTQVSSCMPEAEVRGENRAHSASSCSIL